MYKTILVPFLLIINIFKAASLLSIEANIPFDIFFTFFIYFFTLFDLYLGVGFVFQVYSTTLFMHQLLNRSLGVLGGKLLTNAEQTCCCTTHNDMNTNNKNIQNKPTEQKMIQNKN